MAISVKAKVVFFNIFSSAFFQEKMQRLYEDDEEESGGENDLLKIMTNNESVDENDLLKSSGFKRPLNRNENNNQLRGIKRRPGGRLTPTSDGSSEEDLPIS